MKLDQFKCKLEAIEYLRNEKGIESYEAAEKYLYAHLPKEKEYQKKIIEYLKRKYPKAFIWKAAAGPYVRRGIPDVCMILDGRFYGFEVKRPYIGKATKIQTETIKQINEAGGVAGVVTFPTDIEKMLRRERNV